MTAHSTTERLRLMTAPDDPRKVRGAEIDRRFEAGPHGWKAAVARIAGVSRQTIANAIQGGAAIDTYDKIEAALDELEHPEDVPAQPAALTRLEGELIEFEITVEAVGVRVVVRGPAPNADELERQAAAIYRDILRGEQDGE